MIRKNIYLTEKQQEFITQYIENEGGGTETDVVRQALDDFIEKRNSKFGLLAARLVGFNLPKVYLEISPRGTGKTHRLIKSAIQYLEENSKNKVNIVSPSNRNAIRIKKQIGEYFKNRVFTNENMISDMETYIKCFYDEFDFNSNLKEVDCWGYYCTTPRFIRNLDNLDKNDFLIKLIKATNGLIHNYSYLHVLDDHFISDIIKEKDRTNKQFQTEYLGKWYE
jgi:hypothetical protein